MQADLAHSLNNMKTLTKSVFITTLILSPLLALAATDSTFAIKNPLNIDSVGGLVTTFVQIFSYIVIIFAVLLIVYVGFRFILARGNVTEMNKLKEWLMWIVIGVAVVIGARVMVNIIINTLSATGVVDQSTIQSARNANSTQ
jgi:hypothetical protein